ncbi:MAG: hypothetical protein K2O89_01370 [Clostridia bacterium]|nr:hypothetical protein [Clostridia bacterium]
MKDLKEKLFDIMSELEMLAAEVELSYEFHSHINGYFDTVPKSDNEAKHKFTELAVLSSVQLNRLYEESKKFTELLKSAFDCVYKIRNV